MYELWQQSKIYPKYWISSYGRVKYFHGGHRRWKIKSQRQDKDGYFTVGVSQDGGSVTTARVHRLVADAFIPNPNNNAVVHHKDNNSGNNQVSNLEWTTISFNTKHAHSIGVLTSPAAIKLRVDIAESTFSYYESCNRCAEAFGVSRGIVERITRDSSQLLLGVGVISVVESIPSGSIVGKKFFKNDPITSKLNPFKVGDEYYCSIKDFSESNGTTYDQAQWALTKRKSFNGMAVSRCSNLEYYLHSDQVNW